MSRDWAAWCFRLRTDLRLTQAEAAGVAGVSLRTWRRWEGYDAEPAVHVKDRVQDAFALEAAAYVGALAASSRERGREAG